MTILDGKLDVTTQEGYDIACALRGPDLPRLEHLKFLLVGRLRGLVGIEYKSGCLVVRRLPSTSMVREAQTDWNVFHHWAGTIESREYARRAFGHWAAHLFLAFKTLQAIQLSEEISILCAIADALHNDPDSVVIKLKAYADYIEEQQ